MLGKACTLFLGQKCIYRCSRYRYVTHFYCLAVEAGFYSDVVECLPVDPAAQVRFPPRAAGIFLHPVTFFFFFFFFTVGIFNITCMASGSSYSKLQNIYKIYYFITSTL